MSGDWVLRVGLNEATFREGVDGARDAGRVAFVCECRRLACGELIELSRADYAAVRAHPRRYLVRVGHELVESEDVVERHQRYLVVEKREAGALATTRAAAKFSCHRCASA
jgi:hypothetical protein